MTETERNQIKGALLKCAEENRTIYVLKLNEEAEQFSKYENKLVEEFVDDTRRKDNV